MAAGLAGEARKAADAVAEAKRTRRAAEETANVVRQVALQTAEIARHITRVRERSTRNFIKTLETVAIPGILLKLASKSPELSLR